MLRLEVPLERRRLSQHSDLFAQMGFTPPLSSHLSGMPPAISQPLNDRSTLLSAPGTCDATPRDTAPQPQHADFAVQRHPLVYHCRTACRRTSVADASRAPMSIGLKNTASATLLARASVETIR